MFQNVLNKEFTIDSKKFSQSWHQWSFEYSPFWRIFLQIWSIEPKMIEKYRFFSVTKQSQEYFYRCLVFDFFPSEMRSENMSGTRFVVQKFLFLTKQICLISKSAILCNWVWYFSKDSCTIYYSGLGLYLNKVSSRCSKFSFSSVLEGPH